jgi:hypothetical protein
LLVSGVHDIALLSMISKSTYAAECKRLQTPPALSGTLPKSDLEISVANRNFSVGFREGLELFILPAL